MKILTVSAMRSVDRAAIDELGLPGIVLMENAALGVVEAVLSHVPDADSAVVFCGPGNNGGDGLAVARHLAVRGLRTRAVVSTSGNQYSGDARVQFDVAFRLSGMGLEVEELGQEDSIADSIARAASADVVVDALFGTGLSRPLEGAFAELVTAINELSAPCVSVDLPSGLNGDRTDLWGPHVEADLTVTFAAPQMAHIFPPAADAVGVLAISDLGFPEALVERADGDLHLLERAELSPLLLPRAPESHKGDFGHLLVVAGSTGKSGAAILAAQAAVRAGAGLVTVAVPESILNLLESGSIESMSVPLPTASGDDLGDSALAALCAAAEGKTALAIGPGLGSSDRTAETIRRFVLDSNLPLVLDADGLNAFEGRLEDLSARRAPTVLTPHPGELGRLLAADTVDVVRDRLGSVRRAATGSGCVVVLKGHLSLIADPEAGVYVNPTGNAGMATGGSGDVLTGMIAALVAQGMDPLVSAQLGTFVHGLAGDMAVSEVGEVALAAGDVLGLVPSAFEILAGREERSQAATVGAATALAGTSGDCNTSDDRA